MLFNVNTGLSGQPGETFLISGSSWSSCSGYLEGLGKNIISIVITDEIVISNITGNICYNIGMRDNITNTPYRYTIYDSLDNVTTWINSQTDKSFGSMVKMNKQFVTI